MTAPYQNTVTDTMPASPTSPTAASPASAGGASAAPPNPYAPRRPRGQRQGVPNPWGPPPSSPSAIGGQPGVTGGPNPMAMNQAGLAPQANPASTVATPGAATTESVAAPSGGVVAAPPGSTITSTAPNPMGPGATTTPGQGPFTSPSGQQPGVSAGDLNNWWSRTPSADSAGNLDWKKYANAGSAFVQDTAAARPAAQKNYINNAYDRANDARYQAEPYGITALNRLGDFYNNNQLPTRNPFAALDPNAPSAQTANANIMAQNAAGQIAANGQTPQAQNALGLGSTVQDKINQGRTASLGGALDSAVGNLSSQPSLSDLAKQQFDAQNAAADPMLDRRLRQIREQQAADGRLGISVDNQQNDLLRQTAADRNATSAQLALQAAQGTAGNNLARASTLGNLYQGQQGTGLSALSLGRGLAGDTTSQAQGNLGSLSSYAQGLFGQNQQGFQNAAQQQQAGINYDQQGIQNTLQNNAQNWNQITQAQAIGDPYRTQGAYNNLASLNAQALMTADQREAAQKQGLFGGLGNLASAAAAFLG